MKRSIFFAFLLGNLLPCLKASAEQGESLVVAKLEISHTTSGVKDADTDADFSLRITGPEIKEIEFEFPDLPPNERESGTTDIYSFDLNANSITLAQLRSCNFFMTIKGKKGKDAWMPSHFKIDCYLSDGKKLNLLDSPWANKWFSTQRETTKTWSTSWQTGPDGRRYLVRTYSEKPLNCSRTWSLMPKNPR